MADKGKLSRPKPIHLLLKMCVGAMRDASVQMSWSCADSWVHQ